MGKLYSGAVGAVLLLVGIVGFLTPSLAGLEFHPAHNLIHIVSGALGILAALAGRGRLFAQVFGLIYTVVAVAGFLGLHDLGGIHLGLGALYNLIHLVVGVAGLAAGFSGAAQAKKAATA